MRIINNNKKMNIKNCYSIGDLRRIKRKLIIKKAISDIIFYGTVLLLATIIGKLIFLIWGFNLPIFVDLNWWKR